MRILSARQIHNWDAFTIENLPISSLDLMESAATACFQWLQQRGYLPNSFSIFCGKGNNGGDGLAIARMLARQDAEVAVFILETGQPGTSDFQANLARLHETSASIYYLQGPSVPYIPGDAIVIDALFGTGLNRKLEGMAAGLVAHINNNPNTIIAIDMPSGLLADDSSLGFPTVEATHTLSFQCLKLAFLMAENERSTGIVHVLDIGLHPGFASDLSTEMLYVEGSVAKSIYHPRKRFSHKGNFGHAALLAGSQGFMGAAVLAARACLRSGVGKLTCHVPACGYTIMQLAAPEAMCRVEPGGDYMEAPSAVEGYAAIGVGPGIGVHSGQEALLERLFTQFRKPLVIDADALSLMARSPNLLANIPSFSILTPHPGEFDRLFGRAANDFERIRLAQTKAATLQVVIVLKGHHTFIAMPGGKSYFNSTGNPGMARGGSGDVLTGMLTALLAQGYAPEEAALLGVYLHGLAGDMAAIRLTQEAMTASDITESLPAAFAELRS